MGKIILTITTLLLFQFAVANSLDSCLSDSTKSKKEIKNKTKDLESNMIEARLKILNEKSPIDLVYNKAVENSIKSYLSKNKKQV